jgi:hypothetical protein
MIEAQPVMALVRDNERFPLVWRERFESRPLAPADKPVNGLSRLLCQSIRRGALKRRLKIASELTGRVSSPDLQQDAAAQLGTLWTALDKMAHGLLDQVRGLFLLL